MTRRITAPAEKNVALDSDFPLFLSHAQFAVPKYSYIVTAPLLWLLWLAPQKAAGATDELTPNYLVHVWQTDNGLPENWVSGIAQTPEGYLWVGTRYGGLARFDGVRFVSFNSQNTPQLKDIQVEHLSVDANGRLWIVMGNESITALHQGEFQLFRWPRVAPRLRADHALWAGPNSVLFTGEYSYLAQLDLAAGTNGWTLHDPRGIMAPNPETYCVDHAGVIWFLTERQRLGRYQGDHFEFVSPAPGIPEFGFVALAMDANQRPWIATPRRLFQWNGAAFEDRTPTNGPPPEAIVRLSFSGDGGLWVLERNRLRKYKDGEWTLSNNSPLPRDAQPDAIEIHGDAQGGVWVIHYAHGISHTKRNGVTRQLTERDGIPSLLITCWFQDSEGDVWIGTAGGGMARIRESVFTALTQTEGLPGKEIRSVSMGPNGELWAGTVSAGLAKWQAGAFEKVELPVSAATPAESITVCADQSGNAWIGSLNHGLMRTRGGRVERIANASGLGNAVRVLFTDRHDDLWVGGLVNLFRFKDGRFQQFGREEGFVEGHAIGAIAEADDGAVWIGTGPGDLWKMQAETFTRFTPPVDWPSVRFSSVLPDTNGVVWVGTLGGGLLRFQAGRFTRCTQQQGLPDNNISQLLDSGDGQIWAGTYSGIFRASKADLENMAAGRTNRVACRVYGRFDGLPALECSSGFQPSCWRCRDGRLWFATANGLVSVNPGQVTVNRKPPVVVIEEMLVDGKHRDWPRKSSQLRQESEPPRLSIEPGRHYVQFRFTGLSFAAPDGVRFRAKLDSVDSDWQDLAQQRSIGYGPLQPGDYQFRVIACNNDGAWNEAGDTLAFHVQPFYWETWWFRTLLVATLIVGLGSTVALAQRRRYRRKLEIVERQRAMERERTRIARDLHDDLGTSLTQISMLSALANRAQTPPQESRELVEQVRGRAREMVTALDEIVWAVNPRNDTLQGLLNYLGHFAEEFFRPTGIRCRLNFPSHPAVGSLAADSRHHLFLAFKEAVNNVARHANTKEVEIEVALTPAALTIQIRDHGRGFESEMTTAPRGGNGLGNMRKRMEQAGGRVSFASEAGKGTTVSFLLPLTNTRPLD